MIAYNPTMAPLVAEPAAAATSEIEPMSDRVCPNQITSATDGTMAEAVSF